MVSLTSVLSWQWLLVEQHPQVGIGVFFRLSLIWELFRALRHEHDNDLPVTKLNQWKIYSINVCCLTLCLPDVLVCLIMLISSIYGYKLRRNFQSWATSALRQ